jgi:hypothetical protein
MCYLKERRCIISGCPIVKVIKTFFRCHSKFRKNKLECLFLLSFIIVSYLRVGLKAGSAITNGREPRSCLGRVFNSKLGCIAATLGSKRMVCMRPLLKLKTRPKARPVS